MTPPMADKAAIVASAEPASSDDCFHGGGEMAALMRTFDWTGSALGPVGAWPRCLRTNVGTLLQSQSAAAIAWGAELTLLYNDGYASVLGPLNHPKALGRPAREIFREAWDFMGARFERAQGGEVFAMEDCNLPLYRSDTIEECWFTLCCCPIRDENSVVSGVLSLLTETTCRVQEERRLTTIRNLGHCGDGARSAAQVCRRAARVFEHNRFDVPFALFYLISEDGLHARRAAYVGLSPTHEANVPELSLSVEGTRGWSLADCFKTGRAVMLSDLQTRFDRIASGPYPEPARSAMLIPVSRPSRRFPTAVVILGVSPRRALDRSYLTFQELVAHQLACGIDVALAAEAERGPAAELFPEDRRQSGRLSELAQELRTPLSLLLGPLDELLAGSRGVLTETQRPLLERALQSGLVLQNLVDSFFDFGAVPDSGKVRGSETARILVGAADDDTRDLLRRLLEPQWEVETVADGLTAMQSLERRLPDLVIADVELPSVDGFALLHALRSSPRTRSIPTILLAVGAGSRGRAEALDAGALDFLAKPFSSRELVASVAAGLDAVRARRDAEAENRAKDEFLALLGHELRNPLAPILTALELMKLKDASLLERERTVIERQVRYMVQLVDDLLDVSRVTRGKVQLRLEPVDIGKIIAQAVEMVTPLLEQRQHRLTVTVPRSGPLVKGDPFRLAQVFGNLLTNSAKYTPAGGVISIEATQQDQSVVASVADNGNGIEGSMLERIFEPFVQGERFGEATPGGLGLGLPLVRSLINLHGGTVRAKSLGLGQGSEFLVTLPVLALED